MLVKYFNTDFLKTKYTAIDNKTIVAFTEQSGSAHEFSVKASGQGIWFEGALSHKIDNEKELNDFARLIGDAWKEHQKLAPKIVMTAAGHI